MRHFDVQLMGGMCLHEGKIAEMKTGEGKTLVATLPVYLNALGGKGVISVLANVVPQETHDMCAKWFEGDPAGALKLQLDYLELANAMFCDVNPIPVKEALNQMGWNMGPCRLPLFEMDAAGKAHIHDVLKKYNLLP